MPFRLAIVGRPNVGKSTLFNRLVGRRVALVDDQPGVTRDLREGDARLGDLEFIVVDTAGLEDARDDSLPARMRRLTERALDACDAALFLIDARAGPTPFDAELADLLRRRGRPVILAANKAEGRGGAAGAMEAFALGLGEPLTMSAEHGEGLEGLHDALAPLIGAHQDDDSADDGLDRPLRVAVMGRPNAGKSTLVNAILREERLLTGPEAGITRDSIGLDVDWGGRRFRIFDTAGMRRKARVVERLEKMSVGDALRAIRFAEAVVVLIDAERPFETQDLRLADLAEREGRAVVLAVNKWDLVRDRPTTLKTLREEFDRLLPQLAGAPLVTVSALREQGLGRLRDALVAVIEAWNRRVPTAALNRWLAERVEEHAPPAPSGRRVRLRYLTQHKARPPSFVTFCNRPEDLPDSYRRYLVNGLRRDFGLWGAPVRLALRKQDNPYDRG